MEGFVEYILLLLSQFAGGPGCIENNLMRFGISAIMWAVLLVVARSTQREAQLRMTPDGSRFYATWLQEGEEGSDIWFRRIMSPAFDVNTGVTP